MMIFGQVMVQNGPQNINYSIYGHTFFCPIGLKIFLVTQETSIYRLVMRNHKFDAFFWKKSNFLSKKKQPKQISTLKKYTLKHKYNSFRIFLVFFQDKTKTRQKTKNQKRTFFVFLRFFLIFPNKFSTKRLDMTPNCPTKNENIMLKLHPHKNSIIFPIEPVRRIRPI